MPDSTGLKHNYRIVDSSKDKLKRVHCCHTMPRSPFKVSAPKLSLTSQQQLYPVLCMNYKLKVHINTIYIL